MKVVYSCRAIDDLADIAGYLRPLNPHTPTEIGAAIRATIRRIARYPLSGRLQQDGSRKATVIPYGYPVFYDVGEASIDIAAIRHGARDRFTQEA